MVIDLQWHFSTYHIHTVMLNQTVDPRGGYSLYEGYYICSSVSTPLFQVSGKFVEFRPLYFSKNEENVVFWPLYFSKN